MQINLSGKIAVVAGGCGLIGKAIANRLAEAKADVMRADITKDADKFLDIVNRESMDEFIAEVKRIDIWVNATYPRGFGPHMWAFLRGSCEVAKKMVSGNGGVIINLSSIYGHCGPKNHLYRDVDVRVPSPGYSMVKGGIQSLTRNLAKRYEGCNLRVVSISPGGIENGQDEDFIERYERLVPLKRMANPDDIAWLAVFLASDKASYINGCDIVIDGGFLA